MKLIIAGSRNLNPSLGFIMSAIKMLDLLGPIAEIVSGGACGVDAEGEHFASHFGVPVKRFSADWDKHGKAAGPVRNRQMAEYADVLLLIWDGRSKGSANMREEMKRRDKPIYEVIVRNVLGI